MFGDFDIGQFCTSAAPVLKYVGYVILIFKIAIPILIFVLGIFDLGKAVVASKEDDTKAAAKRLIWRLVAGIVIFFLPNLIMWLFSTISFYENESSDFTVCKTCILQPGECPTSDGGYTY